MSSTHRPHHSDKPVRKKPVNEKSVNEKSANEKSANEKSANEKSANEKSVNEKSVNEKSVNKKPVNDKSVNQQNAGMANVVGENISAIIKMRKEKEREKSLQERAADALTMFSGSMVFVYVHAAWFGFWILFNTGWLGGGKPFDPFPFSLLTLIVSLEAIFLSTFVLISQNHAGRIADKRADLDLQINLLSEHEVTRLLTLTDAIADHLGIKVEKQDDDELKEDVGAEQLLNEIESREKTEKAAD